MSHIAILSLPEPGHIYPALTMAAKLEQLGHRVTFISVSPLQEFFQNQGFECRPILTGVFHGESIDLLNTPAGGLAQRTLERYLRAARLSPLECLQSELRPIPFDTLVCDHEILGDREDLSQALGRRVIVKWTCLPDPDEPAHAAMPEIVLCPREFDLPSRSSDPGSRCYGEPSVAQVRMNTLLSEPPRDAGAPLIYCCFGSQSARYANALEILKTVIDAFAGMRELRLLISESHNFDAVRALPARSNVTVVRRVDQLRVLKACKLFITHGGLGSIKESILLGVPMLVIPFDMDQPRNAQRVEFHRLGQFCLPAHRSVERIREQVFSLLADKSLKHALNRMGKILRDYEERSPAARLVSSSAFAVAE